MKDNWFTVKKLKKNIWGIGEFNHFEEVISYLIVGDKRALLFDTGMGISNIKKEVEEITSLPIVVVNSHCHFDHIGGNRNFTDISILLTEWNRNIMTNGYKTKELYEYFDQHYFFVKREKNLVKEDFCIPSFNPTNYFKDNDTINLDPFCFRVISTPGHSPDSICLFEESLGYLFSGDTLYPGPIYLQFPESNLEDYKKSIFKLMKFKISSIFPAHNAFHMNPNAISEIYENVKEFVPTTGQKTLKISEEISLLI